MPIEEQKKNVLGYLTYQNMFVKYVVVSVFRLVATPFDTVIHIHYQ